MSTISAQLTSLINNVLLPESQLNVDPIIRSRAMQGTEGFADNPDKKRRLLAIVTLSQQSEIKAMLDLANQCAHQPQNAFSLYPVSSGNNWGYGSSQPSSVNTNIILLDLSKLTKIKDFDANSGLVTIEPGVTQQQLYDFLQQQDKQYMVPVTGAGPDCSLVSNALERGYGITPHTDHFSAVTSLKGYWANGRPYQSAINELDLSPEKQVDKAYKWGLGPYLEGLFTQSNFGVVSQMSIRLAKVKPGFISFFIKIKHDSLLEDVVPLIRKVLQDHEGILGAINLMDQGRVLSMLTLNPNETEQQRVMHPQEKAKIAKKLKIAHWTLVGSLYGSVAVVKAVKSDIKRIFKQIPCQQLYSNSFALRFANQLVTHLPPWFINNVAQLTALQKQCDSFNKSKEIMQGKPNRIALTLAYWCHKQIASMDKQALSPAKDGCGLLWYAPLIPMNPRKIREFSDFVRAICPQYNIEPLITFTNLRHDCIDSTVPILFDLTDPKAVSNAHQCLTRLVEEGRHKGFIPYRLNIDQQQTLLNKNTDFWKTIRQLKKSFDPNNILSVDRYNPSE